MVHQVEKHPTERAGLKVNVIFFLLSRTINKINRFIEVFFVWNVINIVQHDNKGNAMQSCIKQVDVQL